MEHEAQVAIIKDLLRMLDDNVNVDAGVQMRNPISTYTCKELAAKEWKTFFREHPQLIGLSNDLPAPNTFVTVDDFGVPVLATRDSTGKFRAFLNACRHRGVRVESREQGEGERFQCPFHHWTYGSNGELLGIPRMRDFGDLDRSCHGLIELPSCEQYGMLWVHPDPSGTLDVGALLGDLGPELADWHPGDLTFMGESVIDMQLNWKLANDTFGETYHFSRLHQNTLSNIFHGDALVYDTYGRNHRFIFPSRQIDEMRTAPEEDWRVRGAAVLVYFLFPNIQFIVGVNGINVVKIYPDGENPGRSITRSRHYFSQRALELAQEPERTVIDASNVYDLNSRETKSSFSIEATMEVFDSTIEREDYRMGELAQRSAENGLLEYVIFGRNEPALHHYHNAYREALGMPALEASSSG
jgi:phenylpropionate dioxygenase-like ring-hydroxylating dioxygenase large terminal subunit